MSDLAARARCRDTAAARARARRRRVVPRPGAGGIGQDRAPDPALPRPAREVERPEGIVAMTFTRKAAGEMRERIVAALPRGAGEAPPSRPAAPRGDARARPCRARAGRARGWELVAHPARLTSVRSTRLRPVSRAGAARRRARAGARSRRAAAAVRAGRARALADAAADDARWRRLLAHLTTTPAGRSSSSPTCSRNATSGFASFARRIPKPSARCSKRRSREIAGELARSRARFPARSSRGSRSTSATRRRLAGA